LAISLPMTGMTLWVAKIFRGGHRSACSSRQINSQIHTFVGFQDRSYSHKFHRIFEKKSRLSAEFAPSGFPGEMSENDETIIPLWLQHLDKEVPLLLGKDNESSQVKIHSLDFVISTCECVIASREIWQLHSKTLRC
jgi:hypothetical protein